MTTTNEILIGGFNFKWIEIGAIRERSDLGELENRFGVYVVVEGTCVQYVGMSGMKSDQARDLMVRIGQNFFENDTGANFAINWMEEKERPHKDFMEYFARCKIVTLSIECRHENLFGGTGIIRAMRNFLIRKLGPLYNASGYRLNNASDYQLENDEKNNIRAGVNARLQA